MTGPVGRPPKNRPPRRGPHAPEEILDASSELFTTQGFAMTSTHQIADAVGIRQASLYYHFPSKAKIFLTLLNSTIEPSLKLAQFLSTSNNPVTLRLWALVAAESRILLSSRWNVGRLYQLPVANSPEFDDYHQQKARLADYFRQSAAEIVGKQDLRVDLPFHLALSAIEMRPNNGIAPQPLRDDSLPAQSIMLADAALTVLGSPAPNDREQRTLDLLMNDD